MQFCMLRSKIFQPEFVSQRKNIYFSFLCIAERFFKTYFEIWTDWCREENVIYLKYGKYSAGGKIGKQPIKAITANCLLSKVASSKKNTLKE